MSMAYAAGGDDASDQREQVLRAAYSTRVATRRLPKPFRCRICSTLAACHFLPLVSSLPIELNASLIDQLDVFSRLELPETRRRWRNAAVLVRLWQVVEQKRRVPFFEVSKKRTVQPFASQRPNRSASPSPIIRASASAQIETYIGASSASEG